MELLTNIITEYLKHNKRLIVPKFGVFIVKQQSGTIVFSDLMRNDDGILRSLLMAYGVKELEANGMIDRFIFEIRHAVSSGEKFNIENFGEFSAGANNTLVFKQKREPQHIGGNIKPPIEVLNSEKRRLKRQAASESIIEPQHFEEHKRPARPKTTTERRTIEESDISALGKPDAYLRGLKYDSNKNKNRGEDGRRSENRSSNKGRRVVVIAIIMALLCVATWHVWQWLAQEKQPAYDTTTSARSTMATETFVCDTLQTTERDSTLLNTEHSTEVVSITHETEATEATTL